MPNQEKQYSVILDELAAAENVNAILESLRELVNNAGMKLLLGKEYPKEFSSEVDKLHYSIGTSALDNFSSEGRGGIINTKENLIET